METFGESLVKIRLSLGYRISKNFYNFLKDRGLECNYQYYVKIEKNLAFPSSAIVNQIVQVLERSCAEELIKAFCREQFTSFSYLFKKEDFSFSGSIKEPKIVEVPQAQRELNLRQVDCLKKDKEYYFLFLLVTLSRFPIALEELKNYKNIDKVVKALVQVDILFVEDGKVHPRSKEFRFPKAVDIKLEQIYHQFDQWDSLFASQFEFKNYLNKMMIRRISPRYFGVIQKQIEGITDFIRCSDESEPKYNDEVVHLHISLSKGTLPG